MVYLFLSSSDDVHDWIEAVKTIQSDNSLAKRIAHQAYSDFLTYYTWDKRAQAIVAELK